MKNADKIGRGLFCFVLFYFVLFCFILFYFVLFCFILFYFVFVIDGMATSEMGKERGIVADGLAFLL